MAFQWDGVVIKNGFCSDSIRCYSDFMGCYSDFMGFYSDFMGFYGDFIGLRMIQCDMNGKIYPVI